jgi:hypothetical protein
MKAPFTCLTSLLVVLAACSKDPSGGAPPTGTGQKPDPTAGASGHAPHVNRDALGDVRIGEHTISVFQVAKIAPGKEGDFDLDFPAGKALPAAVRGWIGAESGQGSMKVRFEKETESRMHGHPEVPSPLPEGSSLWIEIEGPTGGKASVAFKK